MTNAMGSMVSCFVSEIRITDAVIPGRGRKAENPRSSNHRLRLLDSGIAARSQVYAGCVNLPASAPRNDKFHGNEPLEWYPLDSSAVRCVPAQRSFSPPQVLRPLLL